MKNNVGIKIIFNIIFVSIGVSITQGQEVLYTIYGDELGESFGSSACSIGDVNSDGVPDFVVCSSIEMGYLEYSGKASVYSGADGTVLYTVNGKSSNDRFGVAVSDLGDVNADGIPDFIVGGHSDDNGKGSVWVLSGSDGSEVYKVTGEDPLDHFGVSISNIGDIDGDGINDFIVGSEESGKSNRGSARVLSGADGWLLYTFTGDSNFEGFGFSISGLGDVNSDGVPDYLIGVPSDKVNGVEGLGSIRVISGKDGRELYAVFGNKPATSFGISIKGIADVNLDKIPDFIVGAQGENGDVERSGSVSVFSGADGSIIYKIFGESAFAQMGNSVSGIGDVNSDKIPDFTVGAMRDDSNGEDSGSVFVFSGANGTMQYSFKGDSPGDLFGRPVSGLGDVNSDGIPDFFACTRMGNDSKRSYVRVYSGASTQTVQEWYQHP